MAGGGSPTKDVPQGIRPLTTVALSLCSLRSAWACARRRSRHRGAEGRLGVHTVNPLYRIDAALALTANRRSGNAFSSCAPSAGFQSVHKCIQTHMAIPGRSVPRSAPADNVPNKPVGIGGRRREVLATTSFETMYEELGHRPLLTQVNVPSASWSWTSADKLMKLISTPSSNR